jgi:hypothetical protein
LAVLFSYIARMRFSETYQHEVIQSRRDRSRRAHFWSRLLGIVLMLTLGAILRSEPQLRQDLAIAGSDAILWVSGRVAQPAASRNAPSAPPAPTGVKINRFGSTSGQTEGQAVATGRRLAARRNDD